MHYLVTASEMRALDEHTINTLGVPGYQLMTLAGEAVAAHCLRRLKEPAAVTVACGKGNNGGDGLVAARALLEAGHTVAVFVVAPRDALQGDAAMALADLEASAHVERLRLCFEDADAFEAQLESSVHGAALVMDALLGTGLKAEVRGPISAVIDLLNQAECPLVAVDIPSGVHADSGAMLGNAVVADATVTFAFAKRGHHQYPGAGCTGQLEVVDIGIPLELARDFNVTCEVLDCADGPALIPARARDSHKGTYGHLGVWAGSPSMPGAAVLCLQGALKGGAGLVSWIGEEATFRCAPRRPLEAILRSPAEGVEGLNALVVGPGWGLGDARRTQLEELLGEASLPLCLDASALTLLADLPEALEHTAAEVILTPHPKEFSRLSGLSVEEIQGDRVEVAKAFAIKHGCCVVLKGARTVVASSSGDTAIIQPGNPGMATAGTGDVLAGIIGAFAAQGMTPYLAARAGVLLHACAGDLATAQEGEAGMVASDIILSMGTVWRGWNR